MLWYAVNKVYRLTGQVVESSSYWYISLLTKNFGYSLNHLLCHSFPKQSNKTASENKHNPVSSSQWDFILLGTAYVRTKLQIWSSLWGHSVFHFFVPRGLPGITTQDPEEEEEEEEEDSSPVGPCITASQCLKWPRFNTTSKRDMNLWEHRKLQRHWTWSERSIAPRGNKSWHPTSKNEFVACDTENLTHISMTPKALKWLIDYFICSSKNMIPDVH